MAHRTSSDRWFIKTASSLVSALFFLSSLGAAESCAQIHLAPQSLYRPLEKSPYAIAKWAEMDAAYGAQILCKELETSIKRVNLDLKAVFEARRRAARGQSWSKEEFKLGPVEFTDSYIGHTKDGREVIAVFTFKNSPEKFYQITYKMRKDSPDEDGEYEIRRSNGPRVAAFSLIRDTSQFKLGTHPNKNWDVSLISGRGVVRASAAGSRKSSSRAWQQGQKTEVLFSVLDALPDRVADEVEEAKAGNISAIHIDYLDGKFTPGSEPFDCVRQIQAIASIGMPLEVHLMAVEPQPQLIERMIAAGLKPRRDRIALHFESFKDVNYLWQLITQIKDKGLEVSLVLNNETPLAVIDHLSDLMGRGIGYITLMSITPGATSRPFLGIQALEKISALRKKLHEMGADDVRIETDGGINEESLEKVMDRGPDAIVSRTWLLKSGRNLADALAGIRKIDDRITIERQHLDEMLRQNGIALDHYTIDAIVQFCKGSEVFLKDDIRKYLENLPGLTAAFFTKDKVVDISLAGKLLRFHKDEIIPIEHMGLKDRTYYKGVTVKLYEGTFTQAAGKGYILGISGSWHDATAVLVKDGRLISALEEERMTRTKHDTSRFPINAVHRLLREEGITLSDIDHIAIGWNYNLYLDTPHSSAPADEFFAKMDRAYAKKKGIGLTEVVRRNVPERNKARFNIASLEIFLDQLCSYYKTTRTPPVSFVRHHRAHAAAAYYPSGFAESVLVMSIDGYGDTETGTIWIGSHSELEEVGRFTLPHSLGWVYSAITEYLNFRPTFAEGEVMGFAPYGEPRDDGEFDRVNKLREIFADYISFDAESGGLLVNPENFYYGEMIPGKMRITKSFVEKIKAIVPPCTKSSKEIDPLLEDDRPYANLAYVLQETTEKVLMDITRYFLTQHPRTKNLKRVAFSGGVALNILANGRLISEGIVSGDNIFIQPAASDAGTALGAALAVAHDIYGEDVRHEMTNAFYGPAYTDEEIESVLMDFGLRSGVDYEKVTDGELVERAAQCIKDNKPIAWFEGRSELGPRALGSRSILLNLLDDTANNTANLIKGRQPWRPSASSVIEEAAREYFVGISKSPFMIIAFDVLLPKKPLMASGIHQYGKRLARPQTIDKESHPLYWQLLTRVGELIGVPAVVNTSFNKGEPLVESPEEALNTFRYMKHVDQLYIGHFIVKKSDRIRPTVTALQEEPALKESLKKALETGDVNDWDELFDKAAAILPDSHRIVVSFARGASGAKDIYIPMAKELFESPIRPLVLRYVASVIYNHAVTFGADRIYLGSTSEKMNEPVYYLMREYLQENFPRMAYFANMGMDVEILPFSKRGEVVGRPAAWVKNPFKAPEPDQRKGIYVGVDVGAARVKCVVLKNGEEIHREIVDTTYAGGEELKKLILGLIQKAVGVLPIEGIGISLPGVVTPHDNEILWLVNYETRWLQRGPEASEGISEDYHSLAQMRDELREIYSIGKVVFLNDASAFGIGALDADRGEDAVLLALGTGAGAARIEGGAIDMARIEQSGAFVINVREDAVFDKGCAVKGGFAAYVGSDGIVDISKRLGLPVIAGKEELSAYTIAQLLKSERGIGIAEAKRVYYDLAGPIVSWIKLLHKMRHDKRFILTGGTTLEQAGNEILNAIRQRLNDDLKEADISVSLSKDDRELGGARGAALFAMGQRSAESRTSSSGALDLTLARIAALPYFKDILKGTSADNVARLKEFVSKNARGEYETNENGYYYKHGEAPLSVKMDGSLGLLLGLDEKDVPLYYTITISGAVNFGSSPRHLIKEATDLAREMSFKNPLAEVFFDGGKTVLFVDGRNYVAVTAVYGDRELYEKGFVVAKGGVRIYQPEGVNISKEELFSAVKGYVLGFADLGTLGISRMEGPDMSPNPDIDVQDIMEYIDSLWARVKRDLKQDLFPFTTSGRPEHGYLSHDEWRATSYSVLESIAAILDDDATVKRFGLASMSNTMLIQGLGEVGCNIIRLLSSSEKGREYSKYNFKIAGVADRDFAFYCEEGLPFEDLLGLAEARRNNDRAGEEYYLGRLKKYKLENRDSFLFQRAKILIPAGPSYVIKDAQDVVQLGCKILAPAANSIFGREDSKPGEEEELERLILRRGIISEPSWMANFGGIATSKEEVLHRFIEGSLDEMTRPEKREWLKAHVLGGDVSDVAWLNTFWELYLWKKEHYSRPLSEIMRERAERILQARKEILLRFANEPLLPHEILLTADYATAIAKSRVLIEDLGDRFGDIARRMPDKAAPLMERRVAAYLMGRSGNQVYVKDLLEVLSDNDESGIMYRNAGASLGYLLEAEDTQAEKDVRGNVIAKLKEIISREAPASADDQTKAAYDERKAWIEWILRKAEGRPLGIDSIHEQGRSSSSGAIIVDERIVADTETLANSVNRIIGMAGDELRKDAESAFGAADEEPMNLILIRDMIPKSARQLKNAPGYMQAWRDHFKFKLNYPGVCIVKDVESAISLLSNPDNSAWNWKNTIIGIDSENLRALEDALRAKNMAERTKILDVGTIEGDEVILIKTYLDLMATLVRINRPINIEDRLALRLELLLESLGVEEARINEFIQAVTTDKLFGKDLRIFKLPEIRRIRTEELPELYEATKPARVAA